MIYSVTAVVRDRADSYGYQWTPDYIGRGISQECMIQEEIPERMKAVQGMKEVNTLQKAYQISLAWEDMEETEYVKLHRRMKGQEGKTLETGAWCGKGRATFSKVCKRAGREDVE